MRLKLSALKENSWLQGGASMSTTPLCTPDVLESSGPTVRTYVNATYKVTAWCNKIFLRKDVWWMSFILRFSCLWSFFSLRLLTVVRERVSFWKVSTTLPLQSDESWRWRAQVWRPDGVHPLPPPLLLLPPRLLQQHPKRSQRKLWPQSRASLNSREKENNFLQWWYDDDPPVGYQWRT